MPLQQDPMQILEDVAIMQRADSLLYNAMTGMGDPASDKEMHTVVGPGGFDLGKRSVERLYESSWILQRACTAYADAATRKWIDVTLGEEEGSKDAIDKFTTYMERLKIRDVFRTLPAWANIYGGAAAILVVEDGQSYDQPLDKKSIKTIKSIEMLDGYKIWPDLLYDQNPLDPYRYELTLAPNQMRRLTELGLDRLRHIHHTRVIRFDGVEVPPDLMLKRRGWSQSLINLVWDSFQRYETGGKGSSSMIAAFDLFTYKMQGLRSISTMDNGEAEIKERFKLLQLSMSQFNGLIMDSSEEAQFISRTFAGISDILEHLKSDLIGATGIPHTIMFGESPSGLGATGESEERTWANQCSAYQESKLRPKLTQIMELIWLAEDGPTGGKIPKDWGFTFQSLIQESQKEVLENRNSQSSIDNTYFQAGILLPEEIRNSRFGGDQYSFETQLDTKLWDKKKKEEEEAKTAEMEAGSQQGYDPFAAYATEQPSNQSNGNGNGKPPEAQKTDSMNDFEMIAIAETRRNFRFPESEYARVWRENRIKELSNN